MGSSMTPGSSASRRSRGFHPLDPSSAPPGRLEWVREVLRLSGNVVARELHDADRVGGLAVVGQDEFGDPEIPGTGDSPDGEALLARLQGARDLDVGTPPDSLARLRVFQHR